MTCRMVKISRITVDVRYQGRQALHDKTLANYRTVIRENAKEDWPFEEPCVLYLVDGELILADGFHRLEAMRQCDREQVLADIREGSERDLLLYVLQANARHGLPRSSEDKRRVVRLALDDPQLAKLSNTQVAEYCVVSAPLVGRERKARQQRDSDTQQPSEAGDESVDRSDDGQPVQKTATSHGRQYPATADDRETQQARIRQCLTEDASVSNRKIGDDVGCDPKTVAAVRRRMNEEPDGATEASDSVRETELRSDSTVGEPAGDASSASIGPVADSPAWAESVGPQDDQDTDDEFDDDGVEDRGMGDESGAAADGGEADDWSPDMERLAGKDDFQVTVGMSDLRDAVYEELRHWPRDYDEDFAEYLRMLAREILAG